MHLNETKTLKQKIEQQNAEVKRLELNCTNNATTIQQLEETISILKKSNEDLKQSNEDLKVQLQTKETLLENLNKSTADLEFEVSFEETSFDSCEEETTCNKRVSGRLHSYSSSPTSQTHRNRSCSELPNQVVLI